MHSLQNKKILVGVTGGIAAYKSAELIRLLTQVNAQIRVVMTDTATQFITPLTLQALSGGPVYVDLMDAETGQGMDHIALAKWADLILIAPASANTIAKLAHGIADNLLGTLCLASSAPLYLAPAMNQQMWHHPAIQDNIQCLKKRGAIIIGPASGQQACGDTGLGRMMEPAEILSAVEASLQNDLTQPLLGLHVVITAGPTCEALDPVRYLTNHSSGKMGFALADAAVLAGAKVTLVSGPVHLEAPQGVNKIEVISAKDMYLAAQQACQNANIFIAAAAVADYTFETISKQKIKKSDDHITLPLSRTVDILKSISADINNKALYTVGFAAETDNLIAYAQKKLTEKNLDMIIANDVNRSDIGFNSDHNQVSILLADGTIKNLPKATKSTIAKQIIVMIGKEHA